MEDRIKEISRTIENIECSIGVVIGILFTIWTLLNIYVFKRQKFNYIMERELYMCNKLLIPLFVCFIIVYV